MVIWQRKREGKAPNTPSHWVSRVQAKRAGCRRARPGEKASQPDHSVLFPCHHLGVGDVI